MKLLLVSLLFSGQLFAQDLAGRWVNTEDGTVVNFIRIGNEYRQTSSSLVRDQWGRLQYKIDQHIVIPRGGETGTVSFFDSRGCSFKDLPVKFEFRNEAAVNFLVTVPRYKFQTITEQRTPRTRPVVRYNCRILEFVEVPVELFR